MTVPSVPTIILQQLGGNKFLAMTGAHHLMGDKDSLHMQLPRNKSKANRLTITLDWDDTYTMRFFYFKSGYVKIDHKKQTATVIPEKEFDVYKCDGLFFDQLQEIFTEVTGMYTHL